MVSASLSLLAPANCSSLVEFLMNRNVGMLATSYSMAMDSQSSTSTCKHNQFISFPYFLLGKTNSPWAQQSFRHTVGPTPPAWGQSSCRVHTRWQRSPQRPACRRHSSAEPWSHPANKQKNKKWVVIIDNLIFPLDPITSQV